MYSPIVRQRARTLRKRGRTHREIAHALHVAVATAAVWTENIPITVRQKAAIMERMRRKVFTAERREQIRRWAFANLDKYRKHYTDEQLLKRIQDFYSEHGRIPLKREFNSLRAFRVRFGSWNHAIRLAGFVPNPELFAHKFIARDGHGCDSFTEKIIDDWLSGHNVQHRRNVPYPGTRMTADFSLGKRVFLEFFGLAGVQKHYDMIIKRKRNICRASGITLLEVYPKDIFPKNRLAELIK